MVRLRWCECVKSPMTKRHWKRMESQSWCVLCCVLLVRAFSGFAVKCVLFCCSITVGCRHCGLLSLEILWICVFYIELIHKTIVHTLTHATGMVFDTFDSVAICTAPCFYPQMFLFFPQFVLSVCLFLSHTHTFSSLVSDYSSLISECIPDFTVTLV